MWYIMNVIYEYIYVFIHWAGAKLFFTTEKLLNPTQAGNSAAPTSSSEAI